MNLYREVSMEEMEKEIEKLKNHTVSLIVSQTTFRELCNNGEFREACDLAWSETSLGSRHIPLSFYKHIQAKELMEKGQKIYTPLFEHHIS